MEDGTEVTFTDCVGPFHPESLVQIGRWGICEGGNSIIYLAKLVLSDRSPVLVVFKALKVSPETDPVKYSQRLDREARVWHRIKHRNILPFFGQFDIGRSFPVLISPYYKFGHIGEYLRQHSGADKRKLLHDVAVGLAFLHDAGVVHGDLKAENILVDKDGVACIGDFGISRIHGVSGFTTSHRAGTLVYMAPELWAYVTRHGKDQSPAPRATFESDIWTFGLVAVGIWTGFPLKTAKRVEQQGRTALMGSRADVEDLLRPTRQQYGSDAVSDAMWGELEKCWQSNPDSRPTMTALLVSRLFNETVVDEADEEVVLYPRRSVRR
ncbi:kinase-like domain-containing protein [Mycena olivaceomarginata]|nr:kinase-like domain-containing protein [Mycena olivaceomarginata]